MRTVLISLGCCCAIALMATVSHSGDEPSQKPTMMSHLKVGQQVELERAISGGYNVNILNASYVESFERADPNYVAPKILGVGSDFIVVDVGRGFQQIISFRAIDVITSLPANAAADSTGAAENPQD